MLDHTMIDQPRHLVDLFHLVDMHLHLDCSFQTETVSTVDDLWKELIAKRKIGQEGSLNGDGWRTLRFPSFNGKGRTYAKYVSSFINTQQRLVRMLL